MGSVSLPLAADAAAEKPCFVCNLSKAFVEGKGGFKCCTSLNVSQLLCRVDDLHCNARCERPCNKRGCGSFRTNPHVLALTRILSAVTLGVVEEAGRLGVKRLWLQPGSENDEVCDGSDQARQRYRKCSRCSRLMIVLPIANPVWTIVWGTSHGCSVLH